MNEFHSKNSISRIINSIFIALIPLFLFGFYKNGIFLYNKNLVGIYGLFKPIIYPLLGFIIGLLIDNLIKPKINFNNSFLKLYGFIIGLAVSINFPLFIYLVIVSLSFIIFKLINFKKINIMVITILIILLVMLFLNIGFENVYEDKTILNYSFWDEFLGMNNGGLGITSIFLSLISLFYLSFIKGYKKAIPLSFILSFILSGLIHTVLINDINIFLNTLLKSTALFGSIFIATETFSSPLKYKEKVLYGLLLGIVTYIIGFLINFYWAIYLSILIFNICFIFIAKISKNN